ncbi:MAG: response regulator [Deferribacteres bacterium]|nr:response regulator [Deferribacteres bacterium]
MKISQKIMLAAGSLVSLVLLIQGAVSQIIIRNELKSSLVRHLSGELKIRARLLNDLLDKTEEDLSAIQAHKAFEDYFTSMELDDSDGMLDAEFELESFFIRIIRAKSRYTDIQLVTAAGEPVLHIAGDRRVERFNTYDYAEKLRQFRHTRPDTAGGRKDSFVVIHELFRGDTNGWELLTASALIFNKKIEGILWIKQPVGGYMKETFSGLATDGISYIIYNAEGVPLTHSPDLAPAALAGFMKGNPPDWVIARKTVPALGLNVVLGIPKAKALEVPNYLLWIGAAIWVSAVLFSMVILGIIARNISKPIGRLVDMSGRLSEGDLTLEDIRISNDEIGKLNAGYRDVVNSFREVASVCEDISNGDLSRSLVVKSDKDVLGKSVNRMIHTLREITAENEKENWLKTGQAELNDRMRGEQDISTLCRNIISYLVPYLEVQVGAIYTVGDDNLLTLTSGYAYTGQQDFNRRYKFGEGLIGQAVLEKKRILLTDVPEDYIKIRSGMGEVTPRNIMIVPLLHDEEVQGVIELASFHRITDVRVEFIEQAAGDIAVSLHSARSRARMKALLRETQRQAEELKIREADLREANRELEEQAEILQESEVRLQIQQERLRQTNEELQRQKDDLKKKNIELENARRMIEEKARELEISGRYKSQFLANMSHELKTPLNSLLLLSNLLMQNKDGNLTDKQVEFASTIHKASSDLLMLINDILDLSKIEAGRVEITFDEMEIDDFLAGMEQSFIQVAREKGLRFRTEKADSLPACIVTDRQRVEQIVRNLLSNSFKFTRRGGITLSVRRPDEDADLSGIGLDPAETVAVVVSDTGIGIPEDKQKLIFEAFRQVDGNISRQYGGTGLGLSISRELAGLLGGDVRLQSREGHGSTFILYLPERPENMKESHERTPAAPRPEDVHISTAVHSRNEVFKGKKILVADDDMRNAYALSNVLEQKDMKVLIVKNGREAVQCLQENPDINLVIMDIMMPEMDGYEAMRRIRMQQRFEKLPVIALTAKADRDDRNRCMEAGASDYLAKPFNIEKLLSIIRVWLYEGEYSGDSSIVAGTGGTKP